MRHREALGLLALLALLAAAGCGTRRSVINPEADGAGEYPLLTEPLRKGDLVELQLADGSRVTGKVRGFAPDALILRVAKHPTAAPSIFRRTVQRRIALADIRGGVCLGRSQPPNLLAYLGTSLVVVALALLIDRSS
jgi:hypothetical protein